MNPISRFTPINDLDPSCSLTHVMLCIYHIDPDLVNQKLNILPTHQQKKDALSILPRGEKIINAISSWVLDSERNVSSKDTRTHLNWLLDKLEPVGAEILELQRITDVKMTIRCIWFSAEGLGGPTIWPEQMEKMAKLNLECAFSFADYSEDNNKESGTQGNDPIS